MVASRRPSSDEVEALLTNAQLRDDLEPYVDESITALNLEQMPTPVENRYLASMLAWELAPALPIARWFEPELRLPAPDLLTDGEIAQLLLTTVDRLFSQHIVIDFADHLSDRELYTLIVRDILPAREKRVEDPEHWLHWDCAGATDDAEVWLRFYASDEEREGWAEHADRPLPPVEIPPYPRHLPTRPL